MDSHSEYLRDRWLKAQAKADAATAARSPLAPLRRWYAEQLDVAWREELLREMVRSERRPWWAQPVYITNIDELRRDD